MKTFENVMEIFRDYLDSDQEEEVLKCRRGCLRVTWNGDSRYCVDGILCRTPMKNWRNSSAKGCGNDGRRKPNEGIVVDSETAA